MASARFHLWPALKLFQACTPVRLVQLGCRFQFDLGETKWTSTRSKSAKRRIRSRGGRRGTTWLISTLFPHLHLTCFSCKSNKNAAGHIYPSSPTWSFHTGPETPIWVICCGVITEVVRRANVSSKRLPSPTTTDVMSFHRESFLGASTW